MITPLKQSHGSAFGFAVEGKLTEADALQLGELIAQTVAAHKHPIGLLADLSAMHGATWAARWDEMRFLQRFSDHIARIAIVCNDQWQELSEMVLIVASFMQAETVYCTPADIGHAWHWVRMNPATEPMPLRIVYPGKGLFQNYTPEYVGL